MIELRVAEIKDLSLIAQMADEIWHSYYSDFLSSDQIDYMLNKFYNQNALITQIENGHTFYFILEKGQSNGFISMSKTGETDFFIHKFYIQPLFHGRNIGTQVLERIETLFSSQTQNKSFSIRLTVNRENFKAINFYFKNGFQIEKVEDFNIGNGYFMNDFVMLKIGSNE